ncbi:MAG: hypothetical protein FWG17_07310 [Desulfovibrionaceae bacterium]|nr:hypothetical protein [Desulfovibrionaceae bacterium]
MRNLLIILIVLVVVGCTSGSTIITGNIGIAIEPTEVNIYLDPPAKFETIGLLEATSEVGFSRQAAQDRVIEELKTRAAKIGANGVLLIHSGATTKSSVGYTSSSGYFYSTHTDYLSAQGRAIIVINE